MAEELGSFKIKIGADNSELNQKLEQTKTELEQATKSVSEFGDNVGVLRQRYRQLSQMSLVGKSAEEIRQVESELASLRDAMEDYDARIRSLAKDPFQKATEGVQAFSSVMAGAAGVVTLMGGNEEKLNKIMQQTVALIAIANAAQTAADFTRQNAIGIWLKDKTKDIALRIKEALTIQTVTAATAQETAAKSGLSSVQKVLIALQKAWNKAIASNPIMLMVAAIAALTAAAIALSRALSRTTEESNVLNTSIDGTRHATVEAVNAHNEHVWALQRLEDEYKLLRGELSQYDADLREISRQRQKELIEAEQQMRQNAEGAITLWTKIKAAVAMRFGGMAAAAKVHTRAIQSALEEGSERIKQINERYDAIERNRKEREIQEAKQREQQKQQQILDAVRKGQEDIARYMEQKTSSFLGEQGNIVVGVDFALPSTEEMFGEIEDSVIEPLKEKGVEIGQILSEAVESGIENLISATAEAIGAFAAGEAELGDVFSVIGEQVANFADALGKSLIAAGVASIAFKKLLANPIAAIAAGAALIATAAIVRAKLKAGPGGSAAASGGGYSGSRFSMPQSSSIGGGIGDWQHRTVNVGQPAVVISGTLKAQGSELVAVINAENKRKSY
jgi:hypothetical protein